MTDTLRVQSAALVLLLLIGSIGAPASAQEAAQDPKQPSVDNPHMHFWGSSDLSNCYTHFDGNDSSGSAVEGYGQRDFSQGQQIEIDYTCRISDNFKQDMHLNPNGTVMLEFAFNIDSNDCTDNQDCTNLTITLSRGSQAVSQLIVPVESVNSATDESIRWDIPVNETMERWNKSIDEPEINIKYSAPGYNDITCVIFDCSAHFRMYYSNNEDNLTVEANFPVVNATAPGGGGGDGGAIDKAKDALPGFGLLAGVGALALAAVGASRFSRED